MNIYQHLSDLIMQFTFFKTLFSKLSSTWKGIEQSFSDTNNTSLDPLSHSFNLYVQKDLKLALDMLTHGYKPSESQKKKLNKFLIEDAIANNNFFFNYNSYLDFLPHDAIINFCIHHDLGHNCKNDKNIFNNFEHIFKHFSLQDNFSEKLYTQLNSSLFTTCLKAIDIKPKYEHIHAFEFNNIDKKIYHNFTLTIFNCLVLLPYIVKDMDQFVSLKNNIVTSVNKIEDYLQSHNIRIIRDNKSIHYNKQNREIFKTALLEEWVNFIGNYDIKKLKEKLLQQINQKSTQEVNTISPLNQSENHISNDLKKKLTVQQQQQLERIEHLYDQIKSDMFEKKEHYELDSLYKDLPSIVEKFISIHPDYRDSLKNVEGKSPEQLMVESLSIIESKFKLYLEDINQNKVTDLSIVGRTIKMKA